MKKVITASTNKGTTFYRYTKDEIIDILKSEDANPWLIKAFEERGMEAINFKKFVWGVEGQDGALYLIESDDEEDIQIDGELVHIYDAPEDYDMKSGLSNYVQAGDTEHLLKCVDETAINMPFFDDWAADLISGGHTFVELSKALQDFDIDY